VRRAGGCIIHIYGVKRSGDRDAARSYQREVHGQRRALHVTTGAMLLLHAYERPCHVRVPCACWVPYAMLVVGMAAGQRVHC
jgi:hypothetical protein